MLAAHRRAGAADNPWEPGSVLLPVRCHRRVRLLHREALRLQPQEARAEGRAACAGKELPGGSARSQHRQAQHAAGPGALGAGGRTGGDSGHGVRVHEARRRELEGRNQAGGAGEERVRAGEAHQPGLRQVLCGRSAHGADQDDRRLRLLRRPAAGPRARHSPAPAGPAEALQRPFVSTGAGGAGDATGGAEDHHGEAPRAVRPVRLVPGRPPAPSQGVAAGNPPREAARAAGGAGQDREGPDGARGRDLRQAGVHHEGKARLPLQESDGGGVERLGQPGGEQLHEGAGEGDAGARSRARQHTGQEGCAADHEAAAADDVEAAGRALLEATPLHLRQPAQAGRRRCLPQEQPQGR
mmetsp:Transcript_52295/g.162347  ORF Transcript_52295/g.162347 Transcript_52295/m.162347 type:complete len:355 (-) Transcript_52295:187-1251(-)